MRWPRLARYYTPVVCLLTLALLSSLSQRGVFDPVTAAQNRRIEFQTGDMACQDDNLSADEVQLAEAVLTSDSEDNPEAWRLLYIGNSQSMAIMDRMPGDLTSPQWLQVLLARQPRTQEPHISVRVGSLPNLTMTELLVKLVAAGEDSPHGVDVVLLGLVLEEWRGLGIRDNVLPLIQPQTVRDEFAELVAAHPDLSLSDKALASIWETGSTGQVTASRFQETHRVSVTAFVEEHLQTCVERYVPLFAMRSKLYSQISLGYHKMRNCLFGITSATARPVSEATYSASLELLELSLRYAQSKGIQVILYLAPIRPIQPNPNLPADVARFRRDIPLVCQRYGVTCLDYTDLVPEDLWTNYPDEAVGTSGQRDFAHFTGAAHKLLAERLMTDVGSLIADWAGEEAMHQP